MRVYPLDNLAPTGDVSVTKFSKFKIVSTNFTLGPTSLHLRIGVRLDCYCNSTVCLRSYSVKGNREEGELVSASGSFTGSLHAQVDTLIITILVTFFIIPHRLNRMDQFSSRKYSFRDHQNLI